MEEVIEDNVRIEFSLEIERYEKLKNKNRELQRKLEKFQDIFKELMDETDDYNDCSMDNYDTDFEAGIAQPEFILEKDNYGNTLKKAPSNLGDSYIIIDIKKDLSELDQDEYKAIVAQNDFSNYKRTSRYAGKFGKAYGWASTATKYGKYALVFI